MYEQGQAHGSTTLEDTRPFDELFPSGEVPIRYVWGNHNADTGLEWLEWAHSRLAVLDALGDPEAKALGDLIATTNARENSAQVRYEAAHAAQPLITALLQSGVPLMDLADVVLHRSVSAIVRIMFRGISATNIERVIQAEGLLRSGKDPEDVRAVVGLPRPMFAKLVGYVTPPLQMEMAA